MRRVVLNILPKEPNAATTTVMEVKPQIFTTTAPAKKRFKHTLSSVLERVKIIHGDKYNYDKVLEEHIKGKRSKIPVVCNICSHEWLVSIDNHINSKRGCPGCSGNIDWTFDRFLAKATEIHKGKYNYDDNNVLAVKGKRYKINTLCNSCGHKWQVTIDNHINNKTGCPSCAKNLQWTEEQFLCSAVAIHGNKCQYFPKAEGIAMNCYTPFRVLCNFCNYTWFVNVVTHIHHKSGCPNCALVAPWFYDRFIKVAKSIHGDRFNYDNTLPEHVSSSDSTITFTCNSCGYQSSMKIQNHIGYKTGCSSCKMSRGEYECMKCLNDMSIEYVRELRLPIMPLNAFDYYFKYENKNILLEFDGQHHFEFNEFFHKTYDRFIERQEADIKKTLVALQQSYMLIRIDYAQIEHIRYQIETALALNQSLYLSTPMMYEYITSRL